MKSMIIRMVSRYSDWREIIWNDRTRAFLTIFGGKLLKAALALVVNIILIRHLSEGDFGVVNVVLTVMTLIYLLSSLGLDSSLIRYLSLYFSSDPPRAEAMLKLAAIIRGISGLIFALIGFLLAPVLATDLFHKPELLWPLRLAAVGIIGITYSEMCLTVEQARDKFYHYVLILLFSPVARFFGIGILLITGVLSLYPVISLYVFLPATAAIFGFFLIPRGFIGNHDPWKSVFWELFHFGKWIMVSYVCHIIYIHLDILMLTRYMPAMKEVGIYSIGYRFASPILLIPASLMVVCTPWVSRLTTLREYRSYIKKILLFTVPLSLLFCLGFFFSRPLIALVSQKSAGDLSQAVVVFNLLLIGTIFQVLTAPLTVITYAENKPNILAYADIVRVVANIAGNYILIQGKFGFPALGIFGAALATTITTFLGGGFCLAYIYWGILRRKQI